MKQLACKDLGSDCDFVAKGNTIEEVKGNMMSHIKMAHSDMEDKEKDEMKKKMDNMIKDV